MNPWLVSLIVVGLTAADLCAALPTASAPAPTTRPSPDELHDRAYQLMRDGKFDLATPMVNRAYDLTPPAQRSRALVLNRALLDLMQKHSVMHGIRETYDYLARNPKHDDAAMNILGSLLDVAVDNPKWQKSAIYSAAYREFSRREVAMERLRPGYRRYGPRWITEEEWQEIKRKERELIRQMNELGARIKRLDTDEAARTTQLAVAQKQSNAFGWHSHGTDPERPVYTGGCVTCAQITGLAQAVNAQMEQIHAMRTERLDLWRRYNELKKELDKLKPSWPDRYDAIDPSLPPPPEPANLPLPTTYASEPPAPDESLENVLPKGVSP